MKQTILATAVALMASAACVQAQSYVVEPTNPDMLHLTNRIPDQSRREFILPASVGGYLPLKTDLHMHTYYSDGNVSPVTRIREAWLDGLDAVAITEHIEYHPFDDDMRRYMRLPGALDGIKDPKERKKAAKDSKRTHTQDHNISLQLAQKAAPNFDILVIPGTEITREPREIGHYNALFTTDNNAIYNDDPLQAIRNAKAQGALVMHNHPGWRRSSIQHPEFEVKAYGEGLIDGIEVINGEAFCPGTIDRARDKNLFVASTTDLHDTSAEVYAACGLKRDMTIVLASERSLEGIRQGLEQRRTIAFGAGGTICAQPELLKQLFDASVKTERIAKGRVKLTNPTSLQFNLQKPGENPVLLAPFSSLILTPDKDGRLTVTVLNMWQGADAHPTYTL